MSDRELGEKKESFSKLMDKPCGVNTLLESEKVRLMDEFLTIYANATELLKSNDNIKIEELWFKLFTEEKYYRNTKQMVFIH